jgi:hypothetical protein
MFDQAFSINTLPVPCHNLVRMKTVLTVAAALLVASCAANLPAAETNTLTARVGIYDSRAVAYAHFSSAENLQKINQLTQAALAARAAGQTNRLQAIAATLRQEQDEIHREIYSTAPATDAMASLKNRIPEIEKQARVGALISKWDDAALKRFPNAVQVDLTGRLVSEFNPTEAQLKVISGVEKSKPLPLDQCNELIRKGAI